MINLFLDESGESSFSPNSSFKHFLITILSNDTAENNQLKNRVIKHNADIYNKGWDKNDEIKASDLNRDKKYGPNSIKKVLLSLKKLPSLEISYIVINKDEITSPSIRTAPYGIAYNYFSSKLLSDLIFKYKLYKTHLIYDKRNKEAHPNKHFREYLSSQVWGNAFEKKVSVYLTINGEDSRTCYGLAAVDYFCWSIFRKFEQKDNRFFDLFRDKVKLKREWYIKK